MKCERVILKNLIQPGDIVITQGAGNVGALAISLAEVFGQWSEAVSHDA